HAVVHGPRAGLRRSVGRPGGGRVGAWGDPLRVPHRTPALSGGDAHGDDRTGLRAGAGGANSAAAEDAARPEHDLPEMPAEGPGAARGRRGGAGRRPAALPERRGDPRAPGRGGGARLALVPPQPVAGGDARLRGRPELVIAVGASVAVVQLRNSERATQERLY